MSIVMDNGTPAYQRDGERYPHGFAGGGLVDAVESDEQAREAAETYHSRMTSGFILTLTGTACAIGGVILLTPPENRTDTETAIGTGALVCALGTLIAGSVLVITAQPYQYDAINIYNDHVEQRRMMPPPYYVPVAPPPAVQPPPAPPGAVTAPDATPRTARQRT